MMQLNRACRRLCTDADAYNPRNVVRVLHRVQELLGAKVEFPRVVMCGDQSSGKTSVIEALIGEDISCKDSKMATRRPLLLSLIRTPRGAMKVSRPDPEGFFLAYTTPSLPLLQARFADGETVYSFEEVKDRIMAENDIKNTGGLDIGHTPIELTIYSEDVFVSHSRRGLRPAENCSSRSTSSTQTLILLPIPPPPLTGHHPCGPARLRRHPVSGPGR